MQILRKMLPNVGTFLTQRITGSLRSWIVRVAGYASAPPKVLDWGLKAKFLYSFNSHGRFVRNTLVLSMASTFFSYLLNIGAFCNMHETFHTPWYKYLPVPHCQGRAAIIGAQLAKNILAGKVPTMSESEPTSYFKWWLFFSLSGHLVFGNIFFKK